MMQAARRSPSAPTQQRRSIGTPKEILQQHRQSFHLPQISSSSMRRSSSKCALRSKAPNAAARSSLISNASTILKSASSSTSTLLSEDAVECLPSMPRNIPPMRGRRHSLPSLSKDLSATTESAPKRQSLPNLPKSLAIPKLSLQGPEAGRLPMQLRNVALIRWIFEEARKRHVGRSSYQARQEDTSATRKSGGLSSVVFREVFSDVLAATRNCCKAYRACQLFRAEAPEPMHLKVDLELKTAMQTKAFTVGVLSKMLQDAREKGGDAELMWQACFDGLASQSLTGKAFGSRNIALRSCRSQVSMPGCASLSSVVFAPA